MNFSNIKIRRVLKEDADLLAFCFCKAEIISFFEKPQLFVDAGLMKLFDEEKRDKKVTLFTMEHDKEAVGVAAFVNIDWENRNAQLTTTLTEQSFSTLNSIDLLKWFIRYGFDNLNFHRIYGMAVPSRPQFIEICEAAGLAKEGTMQKTVYRNGRYEALEMYSILQHNVTRSL